MKTLDVTSHCRGLSLMELVVSMAVTSLIMVAMGSTLLIAGKALPSNDRPEVALLEATQAGQDLVQDLQYAIDVNQTESHAIRFSVADRDSDDAQEWIHYQWSGTAGDPLTRQYNDGNSVTLIENVQDFTLNYTWQQHSETTTNCEESDTSLLAYYTSSTYLVSRTITSGNWYAQYISPSFSSEASSWSLAYLDFCCKRGNMASGQFTIQIQTATVGGYPTGVVLAEISFYSSSVASSFTRYRLTFSNIADLDPDQGICVVFICDSTTSAACDLLVNVASSSSSNRQLLKSDDDGVSWSIQTDRNMRFYTYGTVTSDSDSTLSTSRGLQNVEITLNTLDEDRARFQTRIDLINQPEVMD